MGFSKKPPPPKEGVKAVWTDVFSLTITVSEETLEKFENLKRLLGHQKLNHDGLMNFMIEAAMKEAEKRKAKLIEKPRMTAPAQSPVGRVTSAAVKREVYIRNKGKYRNCGSNYKLEFDHIKSFSMGGRTSEQNLRLLCFSCNQRQKIQMKFSSS